MSDREIVERFKQLVAKFGDTKPLVQRLQVAIVAKDLPEIRTVTIEMCDAQIEMLQGVGDMPGTDPATTALQIGQLRSMRAAHVANDPTAIAIAYAEAIGMGFQQVTTIFQQLTAMMDDSLSLLDD